MTPKEKGPTRTVGPKFNRWSIDMKLGLWILKTEHQFTNEDLVTLFNSVFRDVLNVEVKSSALTAQFNMRTKNQEWLLVTEADSLLPQRDRLRNKIQYNARRLGFHVIPDPSSTRNVQGAGRVARPVDHRVAAVQRSRADRQNYVDNDEYEVGTETPNASMAIEVPLLPQGVSQKRKVAASPKVAYARNDGKVMNLPQHVIDEIPRYVPVPSSEELHPPLPPLLFRFWRGGGLGQDSATGFVARKYFGAHIGVQPGHVAFDWNDLLLHLDQKHFPSPWISTSSRLIWTFEQMIKSLKAGREDTMLSIIRTAKIPKDVIFYAQPIHAALKKMFAFDNGSWRYGCHFEYLVFGEIPGSAIINVFNAAELDRMILSSAVLHDTLRWPIHYAVGSLSTSKRRTLENEAKTVVREVAVGIACACQFLLGPNLDTASEMISHVTSEVIGGYSYSVRTRDQGAWYDLAEDFTDRLFSGRKATLRSRSQAIYAFIEGIRWSMGGENPHHDPQKIRKMNAKAAAIGLTSSVEILASQLNSIKVAVIIEQRSGDSKLEKYHQSLTAAVASKAAALLPGKSAGTQHRDPTVAQHVPGDDERNAIIIEDEQESGSDYHDSGSDANDAGDLHFAGAESEDEDANSAEPISRSTKRRPSRYQPGRYTTPPPVREKLDSIVYETPRAPAKLKPTRSHNRRQG